MKMTAEQEQLFNELTQLQKEVATNILAGMIPRDAYRASSGKAKTDAAMSSSVNQILSNVNVSAFIQSVQSSRANTAIMTREEALERLSNMARTDLSDLVEFGTHELGSDDDGNPIIQTTWKVKDSAMQDPENLAAIAELTAGRDGIKIKTHSPLQAMQQLAKMQGWEAAAKIDHTTKGESLNAISPAQAAIERFKKSNEPEQ